MSSILKTLGTLKFIEFQDLFDPKRGIPVLVVHFLALLELARETLIDITQADAFAPIYVRLSYTPA
jgi:segregation and condensation protein A